jgi:hypothetical protein
VHFVDVNRRKGFDFSCPRLYEHILERVVTFNLRIIPIDPIRRREFRLAPDFRGYLGVPLGVLDYGGVGKRHRVEISVHYGSVSERGIDLVSVLLELGQLALLYGLQVDLEFLVYLLEPLLDLLVVPVLLDQLEVLLHPQVAMSLQSLGPLIIIVWGQARLKYETLLGRELRTRPILRCCLGDRGHLRDVCRGGRVRGAICAPWGDGQGRRGLRVMRDGGEKEVRGLLIMIGAAVECCLIGLGLLVGVLVVLPSFLAQFQEGLMLLESNLRGVRMYI